MMQCGQEHCSVLSTYTRYIYYYDKLSVLAECHGMHSTVTKSFSDVYVYEAYNRHK